MWTAIILAALVAGGCAAYGAWAAHAVGQGAPLWPFVVGIPFAYLAFPLLFTIFWFVLAWWFRADRPVDVHLGMSKRIAMFFGEFWAIARSVPRMILYRLLMPEPAPAQAALPVVFLHGIGCNAGVWSGFRHDFARRGMCAPYALS